jgi:hypothetical protein
MTMMLMLVACGAAWLLVAVMLGDAGRGLQAALRGDARQPWMPAPARRTSASRAFTRA